MTGYHLLQERGGESHRHRGGRQGREQEGTRPRAWDTGAGARGGRAVQEGARAQEAGRGGHTLGRWAGDE